MSKRRKIIDFKLLQAAIVSHENAGLMDCETAECI
jgi:hypothetical protein